MSSSIHLKLSIDQAETLAFTLLGMRKAFPEIVKSMTPEQAFSVRNSPLHVEEILEDLLPMLTASERSPLAAVLEKLNKP